LAENEALEDDLIEYDDLDGAGDLVKLNHDHFFVISGKSMALFIYFGEVYGFIYLFISGNSMGFKSSAG
jgi:hypothetical protein